MSTTDQQTNLLPEPLIYAEPIAVCFTFEDYVRAAEHDQLTVSPALTPQLPFASSSPHGWEIVTNSPSGYANALRMCDEEGIEFEFADSAEQAWEWAYNKMKRTGCRGADYNQFYTAGDLNDLISQCNDEGNPKGATYMQKLKAELQAAIDARGKEA